MALDGHRLCVAPAGGTAVGLKQRIERAIFLRWLRGKVKAWRREGESTVLGKVWKFVDGWKLAIGVLVLFLVKVWDALHNGHTGDLVGSILVVLGWMPQGIDFTQVVSSAIIVIAFFHKIIKAAQQSRAGSSVAGLLGPEGYILQAWQDGTAQPTKPPRRPRDAA